MAAAGQERAYGYGVRPLNCERLPVGERNDDLRPGLGQGRLKGSRDRRQAGVDRPKGRVAFQVETMGLRAGIDAESTAVAVRQVQDRRDEPRRRVDLATEGEAVFGTRPDAPPAALAVNGYNERLGSSGQPGHGTTSCSDVAFIVLRCSNGEAGATQVFQPVIGVPKGPFCSAG